MVSRTIPLLDATARDAVWDCKREWAGWRGADTPALFLNRRGGRLTASAVDQLIDEIAREADLVDEDWHPFVSAHTLRHTFATNLVGPGIRSVTHVNYMADSNPSR